MHFTCRSFKGHPSDTSWSQFWEIEPDNPSLVSCRGHLFGLINFSSSESSASSKGRQIISQINEFYYSSVDTNIISQLQNALSLFSQLSDQLSLILAVVNNDQLYLAVSNLGHCILKRGNTISSLLIGHADSVVTISGKILDNDRLLLCTDDLYQNFSWENIKSYLTSENIDNVEENFLSHLYSLDQQSLLTGALIEIYEDKTDQPLSPPLTEPESVEHSDLPKMSPPINPKRSFLPFLPRLRPSYIAHVDSPTVSRRKKINILLALIILVGFSISIFVGYRSNHARSLESQYQTLKSQLEAKIENAQKIKNLNLSDALKESQQANEILQKISSYTTTHADEIKKYQDTVNTLLSQTGSFDNIVREKFFDTGLINNNLPYSQIILSGNNLLLLDAVNGHLDKLDVSNKSYQNIITSEDIKNSQLIGENNDAIYLLKNTQVISVQGQTVITKIELKDQIKDFSAGQLRFWNGGLYVLSTGGPNPSIWKYAPNATGFSPGVNWLKQPSLSPNSSSFAINGDIWVISRNGVITSYSLGVKKDFKQITSAVYTDVSNLVTSADTDLLAFTDKGNQVYTYNKSGQALNQYNFGKLKILTLAYVPTSNTLLILCEDRQLYKISL